jgi:hypothetical protein
MSTTPKAHVSTGDLGYRILRKYGSGIARRRHARIVLYRRHEPGGVVPRRSPVVDAARYQFAIHVHVSSLWGRLGGSTRPGASVLQTSHDALARVRAGSPGTHRRRQHEASWPRRAISAGLQTPVASSPPRQSTAPLASTTRSRLVFGTSATTRPWSRRVDEPVRSARQQGASPPQLQPRRFADQDWHPHTGAGATSRRGQAQPSIDDQIRLPVAARRVGVTRVVDRSAFPARAVAALRVRARIKEIQSALTPVTGVTMQRKVTDSTEAVTTAGPKRSRGGVPSQRRVQRRPAEAPARVPLFAQPAMRNLATPPASSAAVPATPGTEVTAQPTSPAPALLPPQIDVERLSDEVYRHIQRKVRIERERRGY